MKTHFLLVDYEDRQIVSFLFDVEAQGIKLKSDGLPAQVQREGKLLRAVGEQAFWSDETVARLLSATERLKAARDACKLDFYDLAASSIPTDRLVRLMETQDSRQSQAAYAKTQLELLEKEMATRDFFAFFSGLVIPLTCADPRDDRSYALYRGTVWSCARELPPAQWSLLADRFIEQQPMEVKRFSRKATVECKTTESDRGVEMTLKVSSLAASFVSSEAIKREVPDAWIAQQRQLRTELQAYNSVLAEVAARYAQSRQTFPSAHPEQLTNLPTHGTAGFGATRPTPDEWRDANLACIKKRLDELDYYRKNAGFAPMPPKFHEQLRQDIDERCLVLLTCIAQAQLQLGEGYQRLSREVENDVGTLQITSEPIRLTREDRSSGLEYALYRGVVWECGRPLLPEQWRALADSRLAEEEAALAQDLAQALGDQPPSKESDEGRQGIPTTVRRAVWVRDNGRCVQCGSRERLEYDHIIPISKGGSNTERNIELLCEACNRAKSDSIA
jgi:hypothetical protein